ncbi:MAG: DUF4375 domain-containing protein [Planctomycetota bacterium]
MFAGQNWNSIQQIVDHLYGHIDGVAGQVEQLTIIQRDFIYVYDFVVAMNDGGICSYYFNSYGDNAWAAVLALRTVGANQAADLLLSSFAVFPNNDPPKSREQREKLVAELPDDQTICLEEVDDQYERGPFAELEGSLRSYVKQNKNELLS